MKYTRFFTLFLTLCLFLAGEAPFAHALTAPSVKAEAIVLADMDSGNILYEKNMHKWIRAFNGVSKLIVLLPPKTFPGKLGVVDFFIKDEVLYMPTGFGQEKAPSILYVWDLKARRMRNVIDLTKATKGELEDCAAFGSASVISILSL